jgi:hypothetical protein
MSVGLKAAANERSLLTPVAMRKARAEAARKGGGGLVVLEAAYGVIPEYRKAAETEGGRGRTGGLQQQQEGGAAGVVPIRAGGADAASFGSVAPEGVPISGQTSPLLPDDGVAPVSATAAAADLPRWLRVTEALQYLVVDSKLVLHAGVSKSGGIHIAFIIPSWLLYLD